MKEVSVVDLDVLPTRMWGGVALFSISDSYELLEVCRRRGVSILGIEGFIVVQDYRVPDMNCIADFSRLVESPSGGAIASIKAAKKFIDDLASDNLLLEFVLVVF